MFLGNNLRSTYYKGYYEKFCDLIKYAKFLFGGI